MRVSERTSNNAAGATAHGLTLRGAAGLPRSSLPTGYSGVVPPREMSEDGSHNNSGGRSANTRARAVGSASLEQSSGGKMPRTPSEPRLGHLGVAGVAGRHQVCFIPPPLCVPSSPVSAWPSGCCPRTDLISRRQIKFKRKFKFKKVF
jgi:hypothetical protein